MLTRISGSYTWDRKPQPPTAALGACLVGENRLPGLRDLPTAIHRVLTPCRKEMPVARYGGYEFAFPGLNLGDIVKDSRVSDGSGSELNGRAA
jgi:hypothetical protein